MQAKKMCQPRRCCQKEAISSKVKSSPPSGAPNAVATPAATPAVMKSRLSLGSRKREKRSTENPRVVDTPWLRPAPTMAPRWIIGPSGPMGIPAATARLQERNLTRKAGRLKM